MAVRFAPSPTGTFHLGNLRTAWISHWWAKALGQPWILRFEDIDRPRIVYGAQDKQLEDMKRLGLEPDGIVQQSAFFKHHYDLFVQAVREKVVYPCFCSRKEILDRLASAPHTGTVPYTGACRDLAKWPPYSRPTLAWRFRHIEQDPKLDFVIARSELPATQEIPPSRESFVPSYQWACAIDDFQGHYELLVRACDLADSASQQRSIQKWLATALGKKEELQYPAIFHTSLVLSDDLTRLEKRSRKVTLDEVAANGVTPAMVAEKFRLSFDGDVSEFQSGRIFGEKKPQITLGELGFSS